MMPTCLWINQPAFGHRGGDMEDALAPGERGRQRGVVEHVRLEQAQVLRGSVQLLKELVLRIT
jgi:hypothetical protein